MASANSNDKLIIFKGDDTGGVFGRRLTFTIEAGEGVDLSGCRAEWIFDGIVKTFAAPLVPGEVREVFYSHNETRCMALGVRYGTFRIIDAAGKVRTLTNTKPVEVTNNADRCYPGASAASFVVHGVGDMKHSEFADLEEKEGMTLKEVGGMVNTLIRKLKGTVSAVAALLAFGAFADGVITPDTDFGDISPNAKLKAVVEASGAISGIDTNTVDALANSAVVTNALTVATTNRVALLESSKADNTALTAHVANTNNPHAVTAAQVGAVGIGDNIEIAKSTGDGLVFFAHYFAYGVELSNPNYGDTYHSGGYSTYRPYIQGINGHYSDYTIQIGGSPNPDIGEDGGVFIFNNYDITRYGHHAIEQWYQDGSLETLMYFPIGQQGTIALQNWQSLSAMLDSTNATTLAENPTFSNAVLAVGLNIDTNSVAVLNDIAATFGGFPLGAGETATTVGGLLAALAAAVAWLKKNKVGSFESVGGATATVDNGVAKLDNFFTESNSLLTGTIDARLPYPFYTVPSTGILKDRAINTTSLASVTVPDNFTDLLVRASVASSLSVTMPEAIATKYGDTFPGEAGEYLITITKTGAAEAYVRTIKLEEVA